MTALISAAKMSFGEIMKTLHVDLEVYSSLDLKKAGVYVYTEAPAFEILLIGYAFDDGPVEVLDLTRHVLPGWLRDALIDPDVIKHAFNANFERTCLARALKCPIPPEQWRCTAVHAASLGLPHGLEDVAKAIKLGKDMQKMKEGAALIHHFCIPHKTKSGEITRNYPDGEPAKWNLFIEYCARDVAVERAIYRILGKYPVIPDEQKLWELDQRINDRGARIDRQLVANAIYCDTQYRQRLKDEAIKLTGLGNPNSVRQLKAWLKEAEGIDVEELTKGSIPELLKRTSNETTTRVLQLRQELARTSIKKYQAMDSAVCMDDHVRGLLQFYGANRTGRWAGHLVQVQNLPRNSLKDLALARKMLKAGDFESLEHLFGSVSDVLSQLIRTAFIPSEGCRFIVADFSAIEARIIAWYADEQWRMDVFKTHGLIYEASAARMFKVPEESVTKGSLLRQKGKIAELALGYQGNVGAMITIGALAMGLQEEELYRLVKSWRNANSRIVKFWHDVEAAAICAVKERRCIRMKHGLELRCESGILFIKLPSGRKLAYIRPLIQPDPRYVKPVLTYEGLDQETKQWGRVHTYGGKLVENIVQATARDCLAAALLRLEEAGYKTVMHVHDEVILDVPADCNSSKEVSEILGQDISWAPGLPMKADAFECDFYMKE